MAKNKVMPASDSILHVKDSDRTERILFPVTRYENILGAPRVIDDIETTTAFGAPFLFLKVDEVELTDEEINEMTDFLLE